MNHVYKSCPYCYCDFGKEARYPDNAGFRHCPVCREIVEDGVPPRNQTDGISNQDLVEMQLVMSVLPNDAGIEFRLNRDASNWKWEVTVKPPDGYNSSSAGDTLGNACMKMREHLEANAKWIAEHQD